MPLDRLYTAQDVADLFAVRKQQIYRWTRRGKLRFHRLGPGGKRIRIPESAVREFLGLSNEPENASPGSFPSRAGTVSDGPTMLREARELLKSAGFKFSRK